MKYVDEYRDAAKVRACARAVAFSRRAAAERLKATIAVQAITTIESPLGNRAMR